MNEEHTGQDGSITATQDGVVITREAGSSLAGKTIPYSDIMAVSYEVNFEIPGTTTGHLALSLRSDFTDQDEFTDDKAENIINFSTNIDGLDRELRALKDLISEQQRLHKKQL